MSFPGFLVLQLLNGLADHLHKILLECFLLEDQAVLVPDEIRNLGVPAVLLHAALEQPQYVLVIRIFGELKLAAVVHELTELLWVALTELIHSNFELLLFDIVVLFVLRSTWQTLPWKTASQEVQQHVADCLEIISARLLVANVSVDAGIASSAGEVLAFPEGDVLAIRVLVALGEAEIDDVHVVLVCVSSSDQEVVRLDVSVDDALLVDLLDSLDLLTVSNNGHSPFGLRCTGRFSSRTFCDTLGKGLPNSCQEDP